MQYSKVSRVFNTTQIPFFNKSKSKLQVSNRTFTHLLNALWIGTEVLLNNTKSFYDFNISQQRLNKMNAKKFIFFQQNLERHSVELQNKITDHGGSIETVKNWSIYAEVWTLPENADYAKGFHQLQSAVNELADLYENALMLAMQQPDKASALFLFAHHLSSFNAFLNENNGFGQKNNRRRFDNF
jgi:hypothetical protein